MSSIGSFDNIWNVGYSQNIDMQSPTNNYPNNSHNYIHPGPGYNANSSTNTYNYPQQVNEPKIGSFPVVKTANSIGFYFSPRQITPRSYNEYLYFNISYASIDFYNNIVYVDFEEIECLTGTDWKNFKELFELMFFPIKPGHLQEYRNRYKRKINRRNHPEYNKTYRQNAQNKRRRTE